MNRSVATMWAEALRSGEYEQGDGFLKYVKVLGVDKDDPSKDFHVMHCCLGVLCEVAMNEGVPLVEKESHVENDRRLRKFDNCLAALPQAVMEWAEIRDERGCYDDENGCHLDQLNDSMRHSFHDIADVIEKHWEEL